MQQTGKPMHWRAFNCALLVGVAIFLPLMIQDQGYFIYYGDFNVQQIPFYQLAHEAVHNGDIFWSWYTDLGANFVGSYSFYLLFSPFFWLTLPYPLEFVPYLMGPLLILKTACAALTACLYLHRFVKDAYFAVIGALLYAFSGWMDFNIFFNHFHEVAVFFPLLLLGLEVLVTEGRKGPFAAAVFINALVNYWFFVGEVVFVLLYIAIRRTDKSWGLNLKRFLLIVWESVLGFACAAVALLPSVMALMGNPRTGTEEIVNGWTFWLYWHEQRLPAILQSLFFPPELPARPNYLPDHGAKWASLSGWLPLFSMTGVLAYFFQRKNDWLKKILALCLVFAMVPGLNSLFILLNHSYYARWFYMPILLMALATVRALEEGKSSSFARSIRWTALVLVVFIVMCGLTPNYDDDGNLRFGMMDNVEMLWYYAAFAMLCLAVTTMLVLRFRQSKRFRQITLACVMAASVGFGLFYLSSGKYDSYRADCFIDNGIRGRKNIELPEEPFARIDLYDTTDNLAMFWRQPSINAFHSIVPPSIMEFYPEVGVTRDVASRPEMDYYAIRPLLSVRWLFIDTTFEDQEPMPGYEYYDTQGDFYVYENTHFLPMGFTYDAYVTRESMQDVVTDHRGNLLLRAIVLEEDAISRNEDILMPLPDEGYYDFTVDTMATDVSNRKRYTADTFDFDTRGFTATTSFDSEQLIFFSVPWENGWSAQMDAGNGWQPLLIEKANIGFMAVRVPSGSVTIRFDYETPGLKWGLMISIGAAVIFLIYFIICMVLRKRSPKPELPPPSPDAPPLTDQPYTISWEEYRNRYGNWKVRKAKIEQALYDAALSDANDADAPEALSESERTLHFRPDDGMQETDSANTVEDDQPQ